MTIKLLPSLLYFPCHQGWRAETLLSSSFPKAMLYAAGVPNREMMKKAPQVGIATVWWEGNPCK
jgi:hypothetical protein